MPRMVMLCRADGNVSRLDEQRALERTHERRRGVANQQRVRAQRPLRRACAHSVRVADKIAGIILYFYDLPVAS